MVGRNSAVFGTVMGMRLVDRPTTVDPLLVITVTYIVELV